MKRKNSKGFTLVELLAVMAVLAIIALIAVPMVTTTVRKAKDKSLLVNAEIYVKAANEAIIEYKIDDKDKFYPETCEVKRNTLTCDGKEIKVKGKGTLPDSGKLIYENEEIKVVDLFYGEKEIINTGIGTYVFLESQADICNLISGEAKKIGSKYECEVKKGTKYTFYVLSTDEWGRTNLIMNRNICDDGTPATQPNKCWVNYNSSGDAKDEGPVTAIEYLNKATSTWDNIQEINVLYNDEGNNFEFFEITGKARLPYKSEVADYWTISDPQRLYDYLNWNYNYMGGVNGYWILSTWYADSTFGYLVWRDGDVRAHIVDTTEEHGIGVRPVIAVKL